MFPLWQASKPVKKLNVPITLWEPNGCVFQPPIKECSSLASKCFFLPSNPRWSKSLTPRCSFKFYPPQVFFSEKGKIPECSGNMLNPIVKYESFQCLPDCRLYRIPLSRIKSFNVCPVVKKYEIFQCSLNCQIRNLPMFTRLPLTAYTESFNACGSAGYTESLNACRSA